MKILHPSQRGFGFTFTDIVVVLLATAILAVFALESGIGRRKHDHGRTQCLSNLKAVGLCFRMWANDNDGKYPWQVPSDQSGTQEYLEPWQVFEHFLAVSNELNTPKILACNSDWARLKTATWSTFNNGNLSYFIGPDADETKPQSILSGDRSLSTNGSLALGPMTINPDSHPAWAPGLHPDFGNIAFADGSVQQWNQRQLETKLPKEALLPARILIP